jgi:hypothetical protein
LFLDRSALLLFYRLEKLETDSVGCLEEADSPSPDAFSLFQDLYAAGLDLGYFGGEVIGVDGQMFHSIVLLQFLALDKSAHVQR